MPSITCRRETTKAPTCSLSARQLSARLHADVAAAIEAARNHAPHHLALLEIPAVGDEPESQRELLALAKLDGAWNYLALPATLQRRIAERCMARYRAVKPIAAVLTHCADSASPQEVVVAAIAAQLPIAWKLTGTRIPDDLQIFTVEAAMATARGARHAAA